MSLQNDGHMEAGQSFEPYPNPIDACDNCGCFGKVLYVESQTVCDKCFNVFFEKDKDEKITDCRVSCSDPCSGSRCTGSGN